MAQIERKLSFLQLNAAERAPEGEFLEQPNIEEFVRAEQCSLPPIDTEKHLQNIMDCILPPK